MATLSCRSCGFEVWVEDEVPASGGWQCDVCRKPGSSALLTAVRPETDLACPSCDVKFAMKPGKHPLRTRCPVCKTELTVAPDGTVSVYEEKPKPQPAPPPAKQPERKATQILKREPKQPPAPQKPKPAEDEGLFGKLRKKLFGR